MVKKEVGDLGYAALLLGRTVPLVTAFGSLCVDEKAYGLIGLTASILTYGACVLYRPKHSHEQSE
jgi:hypothetical protein